MVTGRRVSRRGQIPSAVLRSLAQSYAGANRQAAALIRAYRHNPSALIDLQERIEKGANQANRMADRAQFLATGVA